MAAHQGDAGGDLKAYYPGIEPPALRPGEWRLIPTGVRVLGMSRDSALLVLPRSGLAANLGVTVLNSPGLIDSGYRGEIMVNLINHGGLSVEIHHGMRVAQLVHLRVNGASWPVAGVYYGALRGERGHGSSGV